MECALRAELPQSKPNGFASSLGEGASGETGSFAVELETFPPCQRPHLRGGCLRSRLGEFYPDDRQGTAQNKKIPEAEASGNLLEVTTRFELVDEGFADPCLTTWPRHHIGSDEYHSIGAADEARTRYLHLGKVALYQMSYGRILVHLPLHHRERRPGSGSNRRPPA